LLIDPIFDLVLELCGLLNCGSQMGILSLVSAVMFDLSIQVTAQDRGHYQENPSDIICYSQAIDLNH
jgi:hypothetical protein